MTILGLAETPAFRGCRYRAQTSTILGNGLNTKNCGAVRDTNPAAGYAIFKYEGHIFGFGKPSRALRASWISSCGSS